MNHIYQKLIDQKSFSLTEKIIADYILAHPDELPDLSIQALAKQTHTSTTTIMRFCKHLNTTGFREFKHKFSLSFNLYRVKSAEIDENYPFSAEDTEYDIIYKIANLTKNTVDLCQLSLDPKQIGYVVKDIIQANKIYAIGVSDSFLQLLEFQNKMLKINYYVKMSYLQPEQAFLCSQATSNDVALIVSFSGRTAEIINETKILRQRGVKTIAITANPDSPLANLAQTIILVPSENNEATLPYSFSSRIAIEYVLNVLYSGIYRLDFKKNREYLYRTKKTYLHE